MRALFAALVLLTLSAGVSFAGDHRYERFMLFNGSDLDSTEHVSRWIPVRGANRITLRTWTTKAAFHVSTDADSSYSDSIATFKVAWSDSVSFVARDSSGSVVPINWNEQGAWQNSYPICADSVSVTLVTSGYQDTIITLTAMTNAPINRELRASATGSGRISTIAPTAPASVGTYGDGAIVKQYMRVIITPLRRATAATGLATVPRRVNGLKGLKIEALVWKQNQ